MKYYYKITFLFFLLLISTGSHAMIFGHAVASGKHFCKTQDGGYMLCGKDGLLTYIVKVDSIGHYQWSKWFLYNGYGNTISQTSDGGYIMMVTWNDVSYGSTASLIRLDSIGDTLWTHHYQAADWGEYGIYATQIKNGYMIAKVSDNIMYHNPMELSSTDSIGNILTQTVLNPSSVFGANASSIIPASNHSWAVVTNLSPNPNYGFGIFRIDSSGAWAYSYVNDTTTPVPVSSYYGNGICESPDSGFMVVGWTDAYSGGGDDDFYYLKCDRFCDTIWSKHFGTAGYDDLVGIRGITSGGYIMAGNSKNLGQNPNDVILVRTDDNGDTLWTKSIGGPGKETVNFLDVTSNGGYILIGDSDTNNMWLLITDSLGNILQDTSTTWINNIPKDNINVFPNPAHESFFINGIVAKGRVEIYDSRSVLVQTVELNNLFFSKNEISLNVSLGTYMLKIYNGENIITRTIIRE